MSTQHTHRFGRAVEQPKSASDILEMIENSYRNGGFKIDGLLDSANRDLIRDATATDQQWLESRVDGLYWQLRWVATHVNNIAKQRQQGPLQPSNFERLSVKGQKALDDLRRVLPRYIEIMSLAVEAGPNRLAALNSEQKEAWRKRQVMMIEPYSKMLESLYDFEPSEPKHRSSWFRREADSWHTNAVTFFGMFRDIVGEASTSRNGPAVRFVSMALEYVGVKSITPAAIEQALKRKGVRGNHKWRS